jgi:hypothetical protein
MSEHISDITTEHLGPDATEEEADLALLWLLTHGYEGNAEIGDVTEADWQDAVEWALRHSDRLCPTCATSVPIGDGAIPDECPACGKVLEPLEEVDG